MKPYFLNTENYGKRILVLRTFVSSYRPEEMALLAELLSDYPAFPKGKSIANLAGGSLRFTATYYQNGCLLTGVLSQSQGPKLRYVFQDPYADALSLFLSVYQKGFIEDEKTFQIAKSRLLSKKDNPLSLSYLSFPLVYDERKLESVTMESVKEELKKVQASKTGDALYFGVMPKKNPLEKVNLFSFSLPEISPIAPRFELKDKMLVLSLKGKKIQSYSDYRKNTIAVHAVSLFFKDYLKNKFAAKVEIEERIVSPNDALLQISFLEGNSAFLMTRLPKDTKGAEAFLPLSLEEKRLDVVRMLGDENIALKEILSVLNLHLQDYQKEFFADETFTKEDVLPYLEAFTFGKEQSK